MIRFLVLIGGLLLFAGLYAVMVTAPPVVVAITDNRVTGAAVERQALSLLPWISRATGYSTNGLRVEIKFASEEEINRTYFGDRYVGQRNMYAIAKGTTITLPYHWTSDNTALVHELTHVLQFHSGRVFNCTGEAEREAYTIGNRYNEEFHVGGSVDPVWIMIIGQCPSTKLF